MSNAIEARMRVISEVLQERKRQDEKWGEQNHRSVIPGRQLINETICESARKQYEAAAASGTLTFEHILNEEVCEAIAAYNDSARREELIQVAAVAVAWVEALDRRAGKP